MKIRETNESEPLLKRREVINGAKTRDSSLFWDKLGGGLRSWPSGIRCTDGVTLIWALVWNVRDCQTMGRETPEVQEHYRVKVPKRLAESEQSIVTRKPVKAGGVKGLRHPALSICQLSETGGAGG